ncbi:uncharacterized protein DS421_6g182430 [Arachis hypogaea]|nr:uncharacterized protein DS421_6g182430 [Arachis hypogaea]QHO45862.1 uncharacterized protein DS421_6g182430 [Arachis hypogaea]
MRGAAREEGGGRGRRCSGRHCHQSRRRITMGGKEREVEPRREREIDGDVHAVRPRRCHALPPPPLVSLPLSSKEKGRVTLIERLTEASEAHETREDDYVTAATPSCRRSSSLLLDVNRCHVFAARATSATTTTIEMEKLIC